MSERPQLESLFLAHQGLVDRTTRALCRRHGIAAADADDVASFVKLKLVEDDYAILRKFRGESALSTYLTVVIAMLFRDYRVQRWGRWRPSAAARRHGPLAVRLETLVHRDRLSLREAAEVLRSSGAPEVTDGAIRKVMATLPDRPPLRPAEADAEILDQLAARESAEEALTSEAADAERQATHEAVARAMDALPMEERLILKMRYWEAMTIPEIANVLGQPPKPLYRRIERAQATMRERLEASGLSREAVRDLLEGVSA